MKRVALFAVTLGLVAATNTTERTASALTPQSASNAASVNLPSGTASPSSAFAFDLYSHLRTNDNTFVGPSSLRTALSMTALGAKGTTASQMATVLRVDPDPKKIVSGAVAEQNELNAAVQQGATLRSSNHVYAANGFPFLSSFKTDVTNGFNAAPENLDFTNAPEPSRLHINRSISTDTNAKIPELIPAGLVTSGTRMVLTNAVYFKAAWDVPFSKTETKDAAFTMLSGNQSSVPTMHQYGRMRGASFAGGKIVELPYRDTNIVMDVIVPDDAAGLPSLESKLNGGTFAGLTPSLSPRAAPLALPPSPLSWGGVVTDALSDMGIRQAFTGAADFSGMSTKEHLQIDKVIHKTFVAVDEAGTEAAAASAVLMKETADFPLVAPRLDVKADHPFVVVVREGSQVLFIGHVMNPKTA